MAETCRLARYLVTRIQDIPELELAAPVALNIVCFQYRPAPDALILHKQQLDQLNADIVADVHESGIAVPSLTTINGRLVIRAAIVNHRTCAVDIDAMLGAVLRFGVMRVTQLVAGD
jgi:glutamate/tyrosine decarboxylase-like PLP-dependent enzyme